MKHTLFSLIIFVFCYLLVEVFSYVAFRSVYGDYRIHGLQLAKIAAIESATKSAVFVPANAVKKNVIRKPILHPYLGFSVDGKVTEPNCVPASQTDCLKRIKVDTDRPFAKRSSSTAIVGVLGGSFADGTVRGVDKKYFHQVIKSLPAFAGKKVVIYNMAAGAYKQPQQLMHLAYYLSLGAEFDLIINLDGFNEMTITHYGWRDAGLHPAFPKSWNHRVNAVVSEQLLELYSNKKRAQKKRAKSAQIASAFPLRWSPLTNFIWRLQDNRHSQKLLEVEQKLEQLAAVDPQKRDFAYEALGPDYDLKDWQAVANYAADQWLNSSLALRDLAEGSGARYFHFLQPNQYIEGAKPLSEEEQQNAYVAKGGYGHVYKMSYPYLVERFSTLAQQNVQFKDLTYMFKDDADTLYIDTCCHLNAKGYYFVAQKLLAEISDNYYDLKP